MPTTRTLSAKEAAERLGISPTTLYAYVSRGLIRSESGDESKRQRRYLAEDVERLIARKENRRHPEQALQAALHWGEPILESALTLIDAGRLYYRGQEAVHLAQTATLEQVAALMWLNNPHEAGRLFDLNVTISARQYETMLLHIEMDGANLGLVPSLQVFIPLAAQDDARAYDLRPDAVAQTGARLLRLMVSVAAGDVPENVSLAGMLRLGWTPDRPQAESLFNAAMILCADHELNASSFTARVAASAGANPYAVVLAGLSALSGRKHGGYTEQVAALWREAHTPDQVRSTLSARLRRDEPIAGFGHHLYPDGDPRAQALLNLLRATLPDNPAVVMADSFIITAHDLLQKHPTIDFALVTLENALQLPDGAALALFALGRSVGWIAHAIEEYAQNRLIRPRAKYTGIVPKGD